MYIILNDELYHHGIKGQKWGVRRFQNADGSLKPAGEKRYGGSKREERQEKKREAVKEYSKVAKSYDRDMKKSDEIWKEAKATYNSLGPNWISRIKEVSKAQRGEGSEAAKKYLELNRKSTKLADDAYDRKNEAESRLGKSVVKAYNKESKREAKKKAVLAYSKVWNKASSDNDKVDEEWAEVKKMYQDLSSSKLGRIKEVRKAQKGEGSAAAKKYLKAFDKASEHNDKVDEQWREAKDLDKKTGKTKLTRVVNNIKYDPDRKR